MAGLPAADDPTDVFRWYRPRIYRQALRLLRHPDDCEDATQEVLLKILRFLPSFRHRAKLSTWIYRITYNVCMNMVEERQRRWRELIRSPLDAARAPDGALEQRETHAVVLAALRRLPPKYREPLFLHYFCEIPYQEIARTSGVSVNTVKVRVHRAKRLMQRVLDGAPHARGGPHRDAEGGPARDPRPHRAGAHRRRDADHDRRPARPDGDGAGAERG